MSRRGTYWEQFTFLKCLGGTELVTQQDGSARNEATALDLHALLSEVWCYKVDPPSHPYWYLNLNLLFLPLGVDALGLVQNLRPITIAQ